MTIAAPQKLFSPIKVGRYDLKHRIVMAPLTRLRAAEKTAVPSPWAVDYYTQRASGKLNGCWCDLRAYGFVLDGGLIISEGTFIAEELRGYEHVPGIWSAEQIAAWKKVTDGVHSKGGLIFCQLWVLGRVADPKVAPILWSAGSKPDGTPSPHRDAKDSKALRVIQEEDMDRFVGYYSQAALNAVEAGFDGVEVHGANGYLLDQFLQTNSNDRNDAYGGSLENRFRFPLRVLNAVCAAIGPSRVGIRMSPYSEFQGMRESDPLSVFVPWAKTIVEAQPELAYVHSVEGRGLAVSESEYYQTDKLDDIREVVKKSSAMFIVAGGYSPESAKEHAEEYDDLVTFGRYFISNPDLPERVKNGWPLKKYERDTFYTQTAEGYIDFPQYQPEVQATKQDDAVPKL